jgi:Fe-S-cluster containining protein
MSEWTRHGECNDCGFCCETVARDVIVRTEAQVARDADYYRARGFKRVMVDGEPRHVLFAWLEAPCPELRTESWSAGTTSRCAMYDARPRTCREFPRLPRDIVGTPCSYWFEHESTGALVGGTGSPHQATPDELLAQEAMTA